MVCETVRKQVPYTVTRMTTQVVRNQVPYTVTRQASGAYMAAADAKVWKTKGVVKAETGESVISLAAATAANSTPTAIPTFESEAPGRVFVEGATVTRDVVYTSVRMVNETNIVKVPYNVTRTVQETLVKKVPYTVVRMVPTQVQKVVPVTTCKLVPQECVKHVPTKVCTMKTEVICCRVPHTVCKMVPYTVCVKVPYTTTEMVPCTVRKCVQVCVPYEVCVRKPRYVPYTPCDMVPHCPAPACETKCCEKAPACQPCQPCKPACTPCQPSCNNCCPDECCERHHRRVGDLLRRFFHRRLCCEPAQCGCCN
jgi:hypothetical protein